MPLQILDYASIRPQQLDLGLKDLIPNILEGYKAAKTPGIMEQERIQRENDIRRGQLANALSQVQLKYAEPNAQAALQEMQLKNAYQQIVNKYGPRSQEAQIAAHNANAMLHQIQAQQGQIELDILKKYLAERGQQGQQSLQADPSQQAPQQNYGNLPENYFIPQKNQTPQQPMQSSSMQQGGIDPVTAGIVRKALKLEKPFHTMNSDNQFVTYDPLTGQVQIQDAGRKPEEVEAAKTRATESAKRNADLINKSEDEYMALEARMPIYDRLIDIVNSDEFKFAAGPAAGRISKFIPDNESQAVLGEFDLLTGELVNQSAKVFGSKLNQSEYQQIQKMKQSKFDMPAASRAKVLLGAALAKETLQYHKAYVENLKNNMSPIQASQAARMSIDTTEIKNLIKTQDLASQISRSAKKDFETVMETAEAFAQQRGISTLEALELLKKGKK